MRVLLVAAHPVQTSFVTALHHRALATLAARGHTVDNCDLYAEGFDPVMTRQDRLEYHDPTANQRRIAGYVERLQAAEALLFVHPVWNFGLPAILKGFMDRIFVPEVAFGISPQGRLAPRLTRLRRYGAICTYGASRWVATLMGDPPRRFMTRAMRGYVPPGRPCSFLACYDMNHTTRERRAAFMSTVDRHLGRW